MGVVVARPSEGPAVSRSRMIDKLIMEDRKTAVKTVKLLLLGASESGKSTILKQMRILHHNGFNEHERIFERACIYHNIISALDTLLIAMRSLGIDEGLQLEAKIVHENNVQPLNFDEMPLDLTDAIRRMLDNKHVQQCLIRAAELNLPESIHYFLDNFERICQPDYQCTEQDMLRSRHATTGINEIMFQMNNLSFRVIDVGGQRSERRKWIHCFDNVNAVFFLAALSEYNLVLAEDSQQNRMMESLKLFKSICNTRWFRETSIILFLNKKDLFAEKLMIYPLTIAFKDYTGKQTYNDCLEYIQDRFEMSRKDTHKELYVHHTCATDTNNVQKVFDSCMGIIISKNLARTGLIL